MSPANGKWIGVDTTQEETTLSAKDYGKSLLSERNPGYIIVTLILNHPQFVAYRGLYPGVYNKVVTYNKTLSIFTRLFTRKN